MRQRLKFRKLNQIPPSFIYVLVNGAEAELCVSSTGWEVTSGTFAIEPAEILYWHVFPSTNFVLFGHSTL